MVAEWIHLPLEPGEQQEKTIRLILTKKREAGSAMALPFLWPYSAASLPASTVIIGPAERIDMI
jgi:hypothetical protein